MVMAQYLLKSTYIHAIPQHQGGGGMAQFVRGILSAVQPRSGQVLLHQLVDRCSGDAPAVLERDEQGILIH